MDNDLYYIELAKNPIRFDAVSQLTNVFFDDSNKQIFAVRSNGATGVVVKGPSEENVISFCMNDRGPIRSIKFSPENQVLAVQRLETAVEFLCFQSGQPLLQEIIAHNAKAKVYGFVWVHTRECAVISNSGIEILSILMDKKQVRSVKTLSMNIKWFAWCAESNIALICSTELNTLIPVIIKQKTITKLPKLIMDPNREVQESKVTLGQIYGTMAILILQPSPAGMMEVEVYLLNGPGLAPRKCHVLRLGLTGRFAINTVDNLIVVHHQATATSLLYDIALPGEVLNDISYHTPITPGRSMRPFSLKLPSISPEGQMLPCELYSTLWVLFQPNIVIDAKLGCMWYLNLCIDSLCTLLVDRIRLTEFLLQRSNGKQVLLKVIKQLVNEQYKASLLPVLETIFDKINKVYASWVHSELQTLCSQPSNVKSLPKPPTPPTVLIEESDMCTQVFQTILERPHAETVLLIYLRTLNKNDVAAQEDLTKMIISELIRNGNLETLRHLLTGHSLLVESKPIACFLLSHTNEDNAICQIALDMLSKINAHEIIIEVLLGQGEVIDALRLAKNTPEGETISARKFLEAALKTNDDLIFHSVFKFFQLRNLRQRGCMDFLKTEQCLEFVQHYKNLYTKARVT